MGFLTPMQSRRREISERAWKSRTHKRSNAKRIRCYECKRKKMWCEMWKCHCLWMQLESENGIRFACALCILPIHVTGLFKLARFVDPNQIVWYGWKMCQNSLIYVFCFVRANVLVLINSTRISTPCHFCKTHTPWGLRSFIMFLASKFFENGKYCPWGSKSRFESSSF